MRRIFCFSRSCTPYSEIFAGRVWPCCPGGNALRSTGHFSVKHFVPFRNSFWRSRRHRRQLGAVYLAMNVLSLVYTLLLFGGRHPLCGIGVASRMLVISSPATCSARMAASRPEPGPFTNTSTFLSPRSWAVFAAASAETCAAKGVFFREPLKPFLPADDQLMVLPYTSVMVTMTLLNVALTKALPLTST